MYRQLIIFLVCAALLMPMPEVYAGFDDVLRDVLLESTQPVGSNEYIFHPGDVVVKKAEYEVYYSGIESGSASPALCFTLVENGVPVPLIFPSPEVIQIRDTKLKITSYDNTILRLSLVAPDTRRYR